MTRDQWITELVNQGASPEFAERAAQIAEDLLAVRGLSILDWNSLRVAIAVVGGVYQPRGPLQ